MTEIALDELEDFPNRVGFRNFTWTQQSVADWEEVWTALWDLGIKWEWQNVDKYARARGEVYDRFIVHNDAYRLDMAFPLPEIDAINQMADWLLGTHIDNCRASDATNLIRKWINDYVR